MPEIPLPETPHSAGDDLTVVTGVLTDDQLAKATRRAVTRALAEDLGDRGDITSRSTVAAGQFATAELVAREAGVISGLGAVVETFTAVDVRVKVELLAADGDRVIEDQVLATITGPTRGILSGERTALNFVGHLSGIATATAHMQDLLVGTDCTIRDTRKTTPGLRLLEKAAVTHGGGANHRVGLYDAILVKENHVIAAGGIEAAVAALRAANPGVAVQVEVDDLDQLALLLDLGVTDILLDNFDPEMVRIAAARVAGRARLEVSGNLDADNVRAYAEAVGPGGRLAVGAITHSASSLDVALDVVAIEQPAPLIRPMTAAAAPARPAGLDAGLVAPGDARDQSDQSGEEAWAAPSAPVDPAPALEVDDAPSVEVAARSPLRKRVSSFFGRDESSESDDLSHGEAAPRDDVRPWDTPGPDARLAAPPSGDARPWDLPAVAAATSLLDTADSPDQVEASTDSDGPASDDVPVTAPEFASLVDDLALGADWDDDESEDAPSAVSDSVDGDSVDGGSVDGDADLVVDADPRQEISPLFGDRSKAKDRVVEASPDFTEAEVKGEPFSWRQSSPFVNPQEG